MDKAVLTRKLTNLHSRKKSITKISKVALSVATALLLSTTAIPLTPAYAADTEIAFNQTFNIKLPAGSLANAITELSIQTEVQILVASELIKDEKVAALKGQFSAETGLIELVKNTGLLVQRSGNNALTLVTASNPLAATNSATEEATEVIEVYGRYTTKEMNNATGLTMSLRETPQSISIMTTQMIQDQALPDMRSVLKHIPGISMVGDASEGYLIYARGFVLDAAVQVDGLITTPAKSTYAGGFSQSIDPVIAEQIEVLKGAAGILGGLGEPSATVNMIRKRPTEEFKGYVYSSVGRWNTYRTEADLSGSLTESGEVRGRLVAAYQKGDSFLDRYSRENAVVYGVIEADVGDYTKLSLAIDHLKSDSSGVYNWSSNPAFYTDGSLIDLPRSYSTGQEWAYRDVTETSIMPEIEHTFDNDWFIKAQYRYSDAKMDVINASLGDYVEKATGDLVSPDGSYVDKSNRTSQTHSFNIYMTGDFSLLNKEHEFVMGYSIASNEFIRISTDVEVDTPPNLDNITIPEPDFTNISAWGNNKETQIQTGLYGTARFSLTDSLKFMVGGRLSSWEYTNKDMLGFDDEVKSDSNDILTPYMGIVYDINDFSSVYTSFTGIFLPVTSYGADGQLLDPTEGTNTEAGIKLAFFDDELNISAAVYKTNKDNVAEWADLGKLPNGNWIYESIDGVKTLGYELEVSGQITDNWKMNGGYTHNEAEDSEGNARTTFIPENTFKITTSYDLDSYLLGLTFGGSVRWQSDTYDNGTIWLEPEVDYIHEQDAYWLVDLMARYEISEQMSISLNINNVLDETYNRSLWGATDIGKPRNFLISLRYKL
ncbi:MAG: TonB-dependent siderophore receptor [Colwellia sp.]|nr:TonB-dependent siderophore receptor [Colwellia sp.]